MTPIEVAEGLKLLLDKDAIREVLLRYASTIDERDWDGLRKCFTDDIEVRLVDQTPHRGIEEVVDYIEHRCRRRVWQHHLLSVYEVVVDGDEARALTYHTSHQRTEGRPDQVLQLVCRYHDRLRRDDGQWKIFEKVMELGWYEERPRVSAGDLFDP